MSNQVLLFKSHEAAEEYCWDMFGYTPTDFKYTVAKNPGKNSALNTKAKDGRKAAKAIGGAALKGSAKQKNWAEQIRATKLAAMSTAEASAAVKPTGLLNHSKFWIENREVDGKEIGAFILEQQQLLARFNDATEQTKRETLATEYNELTEKWGF